MNRDEVYAEAAYTAYCRSTGGKSLVTGDILPAYTDLPLAIKEAWIEATYAAIDLYVDYWEDCDGNL
jgi:hypothetical protein